MSGFFTKKTRHRSSIGILAILLLLTLLPLSISRAAVLNYIEVGSMYMAYFNFDTASGAISWTNEGDYAYDGPQVLRPLSMTRPGDYYALSNPWADLLNPHNEGGLDAASSRLFGFSLTGSFRNYLLSNDYSIAIQLTSVTYADTGLNAGNVSAFYYNRGNDDWGTSHPDKEEWSELTATNYLIWNGQSFSNMVHPLVTTTDTFATEYTLNYRLSIVDNLPGDNVNATVVSDVTSVSSVPSFSFSYDVQSLGTSPVPEPSVSVLFLLGVLFVLRYARRPLHGKC